MLEERVGCGYFRCCFHCCCCSSALLELGDDVHRTVNDDYDDNDDYSNNDENDKELARQKGIQTSLIYSRYSTLNDALADTLLACISVVV